MAKLTTHQGSGYINRDDDKGSVQLSPSDYAREQIYQNEVQGQGVLERGTRGAANYALNTASGLSELLGGPENAQQQQGDRLERAQRYQSVEDYGGLAPAVGAFGAGAATAAIPGKLPVQMGIGGLQGAAESPESPGIGAAFGSGLTFVGDYAANAIGRISRQLFGKRSQLVSEADAASIVRGEAEGLQFTPEEIRAIVVECEKLGTYAMAHIYTSEAITIALNAGVRCIDHGMLMDEDTMKLLKKKDAFLVPSLAVGLFTPEELSFAWPTKETKAKGARILAGMENEVILAKKHKVKIGFGTDFFGPTNAAFANQSLEFKARAKYFTPVEILKQATSINAAIVAMSGPMMNPYLDGPLGVIQEGAYADLLIVDGNPLEDILLLVDPSKNLSVIMKDGKIYKNALQ
jgi:hypothetical protein